MLKLTRIWRGWLLWKKKNQRTQKKAVSKARTNNKLNPHTCVALGRNKTWATQVEGRILHILQRPNSIIVLLFHQKFNIILAQTYKLYSWPFLSLLNVTALCPGFLSQWFNSLWRQWFNNLQQAALLTSFWRQWFNNLHWTALLTSLVQYDRILGQ